MLSNTKTAAVLEAENLTKRVLKMMGPDNRGLIKRLLFPCKPRLEQMMNVHKKACEGAMCAVQENAATRLEMMSTVRGVKAGG